MRRFLQLALGFYVVSITLGVILRWAYVGPVGGLVFAHALHAHSHTLYFGWGGLALGALWLGGAGRAQRAALWTLVGLSAATFAAFLYGGYATPGIVVSAVALFVWAWLAVLLFRAAAAKSPLARAFLRVAVLYLALALVGAAARAALMALGVEDPVAAGLAVFTFVHGFAWFLFLGAAGLLCAGRAGPALKVDPPLAKAALALIGSTAWLTVPLGVAGAQDGVLGGAARAGAVGVAAGMAAWAVALYRARPAGGHERTVVWGLVLFSAAHAAGSLGGTLGWAPLATALRHPLIIYLHVFLVGVVTTTLMALVSAALERKALHPRLHFGGLAVMLAGLAVASGVGLGLPWSLQSAEVGLWIALAGAAGLLAAGGRSLAAALR